MMNCRIRRYTISHLSLNLLLHYLMKFKCSKYIRLRQLFNSKVLQNPLSTVNIYERWYVFIHMCMQINCSMFLNCLLLASTRASSRARSMSMDALMTRYSMLSEALAGAVGVAKYHTDIKWQLQHSKSNSKPRVYTTSFLLAIFTGLGVCKNCIIIFGSRHLAKCGVTPFWTTRYCWPTTITILCISLSRLYLGLEVL